MLKGNIKRSNRLNKLIFALEVLLGCQLTTLAQVDSGRIAGTARDQSNAVIPGAAVTVRNERTGETRTATTNAEGRFLVTRLS